MTRMTRTIVSPQRSGRERGDRDGFPLDRRHQAAEYLATADAAQAGPQLAERI